MAFDTTNETIDDINDFKGNPSRSGRLLNRGLKSYYDLDTQQRNLNKPREFKDTQK
jgi:hypothetical protein